MSRFFIRNRKTEKKWKQHLPVHLTGFTLCVTILSITVYEKFTEGGWVTLLITSAAIGICYLVKHHYEIVRRSIRELDEILMGIPPNETVNTAPLDPREPTAVLLTAGFNSFGLHTLLSIVRYFPGLYKNFIFVSVAEIDSGSFKGAAEVQALSDATKHGLEKYVKVTRRHGFPADYRMETATDVPTAVVDLCKSLTTEYPRVTVFTGQLVFHRETLVDKILHNQTAFAIQRRLQWEGVPTMIMPIRVKL
jgi:K+ transporter